MTWEKGIDVLPALPRCTTAAEYYELPEGPPYSQLVGGELIMSPSPNFFHQGIIGNLYTALRAFTRKHRLGKVVLSPSDVELDFENVYQPDLYFIGKERLALIDEHGLKGAPDLVIEVISRSTERLDRGRKKANYARAGVREFWAVEPKTRVVEIWHLAVSISEPARRLGLGEILTTELLPGWEMPVAEVFEE